MVNKLLLTVRSHRVCTYRAVTNRREHCGNLRFHVPTFYHLTGQKMINCACSASFKATRHPMGCMHLVTCRARAQKSGYTSCFLLGFLGVFVVTVIFIKLTSFNMIFTKLTFFFFKLLNVQNF